jgi:benzoyl-CoA reductase/2-hydroxyglutaryl-CoA dehydratase subunit BcrC/BadD/HgdB
MTEKKRRERPAFNKIISSAIAKHYKDIQTNRPMGYALMAPNPLVEIAYAAGIQPAFPENYAAVSAVKHLSKTYCETAEAHSYAPDLCSYCRNNLGYVYDSKENPPLGGIGMPDLLLLTSSACTHYFKWWDTLHEVYKIPLIFINTPRLMEPTSMPDYYLDYAIKEIEEAIRRIEAITGVKITHEKLSQAVALSGEVVETWQKFLELQKAVPCPVNLTDVSNALFVLIALVGTQEAVDVIKAVYHESEQRVAEGIGVLTKGEEKHRLMWINIPFWFNLGLFGYFEQRGCVFPLSDYTQYIWGTTKMDGAEPLESLARKALGGELNSSLDDQIEKMLRDIKAYRIDGIIAHSNRSCRVLSVGIPDVAAIIQKELGLPVLILDGDHTDERAYSDANIMNRIDAFLEILG